MDLPGSITSGVIQGASQELTREAVKRGGFGNVLLTGAVIGGISWFTYRDFKKYGVLWPVRIYRAVRDYFEYEKLRKEQDQAISAAGSRHYHWR